ncbi:MAG: hypothetical protein ACE5IH_03330 [Thermodesulfobacteriota bacterium]
MSIYFEQQTPFYPSIPRSYLSAYVSKSILIILLYHLFFPSIGYPETGEWVPGVIHLHTKIGEGDGVLSPAEMVEKVREKGLGVAIINDHDNERVEYGVFPLRRLIKKVVERQSISTHGEKKWLEALREADNTFPEIVIPGIEAVPAYYWEGGLFDKYLSLRNWHKHILIMGLDSPDDIADIPSVGKGWPVKPGIGCLLGLWPIALFPIGLFLVRYKRYNTIEFSNLKFKEPKKTYRVLGYMLFISGILFLVNNFPYCMSPYDPYHGNPGIGPYQEVIDYVNSRGGLTFWAHPDIPFGADINGVKVTTQPHPEDLITSHDYTGFAALLEGKGASHPGGIWDRLLIEYIEGKRERPVWAIGELDYKEGDWMGDTQTVFYLKERSKHEVLQALKEGNIYAVTGLPYKPVIKNFEAWDERDNIWKGMGSTVLVNGKVKMRVEIEYPVEKELILRLIKEGKVVKSWPFKGHLKRSWEENVADKTYYRIDIDSLLIGNPIFVENENNPKERSKGS